MLHESPELEVAKVVFCEGGVANPARNRRRKLEKMLRIGPLGALNGIRMRRWYGEDLQRALPVRDLDEVASELGLVVETTRTINSEQTRALFREAEADLGLSLGNSYIGKKVYSIPRLGMLNIHHEILPKFRGAQGVIWQIHEGSRETGYTIHEIDSSIDTGRILYQERVPIVFRESLNRTVTETYARVYAASARGLVHTLENYEALCIESAPQGPGDTYTTPTFLQYLRMLREHRRLGRSS